MGALGLKKAIGEVGKDKKRPDVTIRLRPCASSQQNALVQLSINQAQASKQSDRQDWQIDC